MMRSETPRMRQDSRSSLSRTCPSVSRVANDGSLISPASPRVAQTSAVLTPSSLYLRSIPPVLNTSSSGCANTASRHLWSNHLTPLQSLCCGTLLSTTRMSFMCVHTTSTLEGRDVTTQPGVRLRYRDGPPRSSNPQPAALGLSHRHYI